MPDSTLQYIALRDCGIVVWLAETIDPWQHSSLDLVNILYCYDWRLLMFCPVECECILPFVETYLYLSRFNDFVFLTKVVFDNKLIVNP